jgi:uncharacterized protein (TIGR02145 family)
LRIVNPVNPLIMLIMVQTMFVFSCSGDDEVMLDNVIKLSADSAGPSSSSAVVARLSSSSVVGLSSSAGLGSSSSETETGDLSSSSSEAEVVEDSSSSDGEISSSSEAVSSSSEVAACVDGAGSPVAHGGKTYKTVKIGCQTWMAENLNYSTASGSECYGDEPAKCEEYGRLYTWAAATGVGLCPSGWHLPSDADWDALMEYIETKNGGTYNPATNATVAGRHLKAKSGWLSGNGEDTYGFAALPGGYHGNNFTYIEENGYWWSSTESGNDALRRSMSSTASVVRATSPKTNLLSVRCVKE